MGRQTLVRTIAAAMLVVLTASPSAAADPRYGVPPDGSLGDLARTSVVDVAGLAREEVDPVAIADTAFARADAMSAWAWDIGELALHLEYDPERAFEFVRDHIRYEPYQGVLRGAQGTLAARAGNAVDRALLLSALLDEMLIPNRFAFARLDPATAERLVERAARDDAQPLDGPLPYPTEAILARAGRDYARLRDALGDRIDTFASDEWTPAVESARDHVWVQRAMTADWQDLDTSMPGMLAGETLVAAESTSDDLPEQEPWVIDVEVRVEHLVDGVLTERSVLHHQLDAMSSIEDGAFLIFRPELAAIAGGMTEQLTGGEPWVPVLLTGGTQIAGTGFSVGGQGTDPLGDAADLPELASVRLVVSIDGPGMGPLSASHVILDRVPAADRLPASQVGPDDLEPLTRVETAPLPLVAFHHLMISTGATDLRMHEYRRGALTGFMGTLLDEDEAGRYGIAGQLWPVAVADEGLVVASEQVAVAGAGVAGGGHSYIARPRVFMTTMGPDPNDPERQVSSIDLLLDDVRVLLPGGDGIAGTAREQLWYGVLQTAIETEFGLHRIPAELAAEAESYGVSQAMTAALHVIDPDPLPRLPDGTAGALAEALREGHIIVVPGDVASARAWWTIDPGTGVTRSILVPGRGGAAQLVAEEEASERTFGWGTNLKHDGGIYNTRVGDYRPPPRGPSGSPPVCGSSNEEVTVVECVSLRVAVPAAFFGLVLSFLVEAAAIQFSWGW